MKKSEFVVYFAWLCKWGMLTSWLFYTDNTWINIGSNIITAILTIVTCVVLLTALMFYLISSGAMEVKSEKVDEYIENIDILNKNNSSAAATFYRTLGIGFCTLHIFTQPIGYLFVVVVTYMLLLTSVIPIYSKLAKNKLMSYEN